MRRKELQKEIEKAIHIEFCKFLNMSRQQVTDAMNAGSCPLGSEKHFEHSAKAILKILSRAGSK